MEKVTVRYGVCNKCLHDVLFTIYKPFVKSKGLNETIGCNANSDESENMTTVVFIADYYYYYYKIGRNVSYGLSFFIQLLYLSAYVLWCIGLKVQQSVGKCVWYNNSIIIDGFHWIFCRNIITNDFWFFFGFPFRFYIIRFDLFERHFRPIHIQCNNEHIK